MYLHTIIAKAVKMGIKKEKNIPAYSARES
ncbi:hypothetical protein C5S29_04795 [ANME-1 cluster archaeon GoMg3.2]|nr:hypothetical protein [ANME-1 cluster archaeon GoMg3.2]